MATGEWNSGSHPDAHSGTHADADTKTNSYTYTYPYPHTDTASDRRSELAA
jgi:hypothetical protein